MAFLKVLAPALAKVPPSKARPSMIIAPVIEEEALVVVALKIFIVAVDALELGCKLQKVIRWQLDAAGEGIYLRG